MIPFVLAISIVKNFERSKLPYPKNTKNFKIVCKKVRGEGVSNVFFRKKRGWILFVLQRHTRLALKSKNLDLFCGNYGGFNLEIL